MKPIKWLEIVLAFTVITLLTVFSIPEESAFVLLRFVLGFVFIVFLPGFCLVNILFLGKNRLDAIESLVLSVALSFGLAGLIGLFLGLSPIGINFLSITVSLSMLVLALSIAAYIKKSREPLPVLQVQSPEQVSA